MGALPITAGLGCVKSTRLLLAPRLAATAHYTSARLPQPHPMAKTIHASTNMPMPGTAQERHHLHALDGMRV